MFTPTIILDHEYVVLNTCTNTKYRWIYKQNVCSKGAVDITYNDNNKQRKQEAIGPVVF